MLSDDSNHDIMSQVADPVTATYTNTLTVTGRLAGQYQCSVSNSRTPSESTRSLTVVGKECDEHACLVYWYIDQNMYNLEFNMILQLFMHACTEREYHNNFLFHQTLTYPPTSTLYRLVPTVSESPGPHQPM